MLTQITKNILVNQSEFMRTNAVIVRGHTGVLLVDPGIHGNELASLADELIEHGDAVSLGFSTHPHWDHLLWHARLGSALSLQCVFGYESVFVQAEESRNRAYETAVEHAARQLVPLFIFQCEQKARSNARGG